MKIKIIISIYITILRNILHAEENIYDKSLQELLETKSEIKTDVSSLGEAQNYLNSNTPVDVITYEQIESSGLTALTDVLRYFVAGFNVPETSVADGSDHVKSFTIRGMSPDQVLVLINGKRVHTSALIHVNGVIGRGSSHVDLNTIALSAIERIEILRDGASAEYGSDAISGVINIILKGMGYKNNIISQYGKRSRGDGEQVYLGSFLSLPLAYDGYANLTMEVIKQVATQRAGTDNRLSPSRISTHVGIPDSKNYKALLNIEVLEIETIKLYSNVTFNYRDSKASTFYRPQNLNFSSANGFLPQINAKILDYGATLGVKGKFSKDVKWDLSNTYGANKFSYYLNESLNYSLGTASPSSFYNGALGFTQNTTNLEIMKSSKDIKLAGGIEYRYENYTITAGDKASYTNNSDFTKPAGSQGFSGFTQDNAVDSYRNNLALYMDGIINLNKNLSMELFTRYEEYSDFGESTNAKMALLYTVNKKLKFRTSGSTGFRAPSLAQSFYSQTSSFVNTQGVLTTQGTFKTKHEIAKAFGAIDLISERSKNFSIGSVYQPTKNMILIIDFFYINVHDKILLTNELNAKTSLQDSLLKKYNISQVRYFKNAADTYTKGVDLKINYSHEFSDNSTLDIKSWFNYTHNSLSSNSQDTTNSVEKVRIEKGQPRNSLKFLTKYSIKHIEFSLNTSRYGKYSQMLNNKIYDFKALWTNDLDITYKLSQQMKISIGANNIFDSIPNKWSENINSFYGKDAIKPYSRYSPSGYSGAYYYIKVRMVF